MMGVGKSSLSKKMANRLEWEHIDLDEAIVKTTGKSVPALFAEHGESYFREVERKALLTTKDYEKLIVSAGGGTPCHADNAEWMLHYGLCVWLDAPIGMIAHRLEHAKTERPKLKGLKGDALLKRLEEMMEERAPYYRKAHMIVSVNNIKDDQLASMLRSIIQETP